MLYPLIRGVIFVTLLLLIGSRIAAWIVARSLSVAAPDLCTELTGRIARLPSVLSGVLVLLVLARGALQVLSFLDPGEPVTGELLRAALVEGTWGEAWRVQLVGASLLFAVTTFLPPNKPQWSSIPAMLIAVLIWAQSGMGHPAGNRWSGGTGRFLDMAHVFGAGTWLGTLGVLGLTVFPALRGESMIPQLARVVRDFSLAARIGVTLVIASGLIVAWTYTGPLATIPDSTWGRLLIAKLLVLIGVMALGWWNWRVVTPGLLAAQPGCTPRLRRAVSLELSLGLVMLAITAFLVATGLPNE